MNTFADRLRNLRRSRGISQEKLAAMANITTRSVQNYEAGSRMPSSLAITERLAEALGVPYTQLLGEDHDTTEVPLLGEIACGPLNIGEENILETYRFPTSFTGNGDFFFLRTFGESMVDAGINPGDLVLIRRQNTARTGDIAVVTAEGETTLKRYYPEAQHRRIRLHPENGSMQDIFVTECTVQGIAVKVIHDL